jgi:hypothetical protein
MCTVKQYRAKAAEYKERADTATTSNEKRELQNLERSFRTLADNEQWLSDNHEKTVHAPAVPISATSPCAHRSPNEKAQALIDLARTPTKGGACPLKGSL